ncbi:MAG: MFS transporter [Chloroherpetonaceae bacterium]|nr:MFS transporter [Chloroherpetonaceae bacterium]
MRLPQFERYSALFILLIAYILNFTDRILIASLFTPIKNEFQLNNFEIALLGSTAFVLFYTLLGLPFGRLADKVSRKKMIAIGLAVWCLFSGLSGSANNFWQLFFCRVMVGVGEATLGPAALSLLSFYFPKEKRASVQSIFSGAIAIGTSVAFLFGPRIEAQFGWRVAFQSIGYVGLIWVPFILMLKENTVAEKEKSIKRELKIREEIDLILSLPKKHPSLLWHNFGYALLGGVANSLTIWMPVYLSARFEIARVELGALISVSIATVGLLGTVVGGILADKVARKRKQGRLLTMALIALLMIPLYSFILFSNSLEAVKPAYFTLLGLSLTWLGAATADVHEIVHEGERGAAIGLYYFIVNWICYGLIPPLIGFISDKLGQNIGSESLQSALFIGPLLLCLSAGSLLYAKFLRD